MKLKTKTLQKILETATAKEIDFLIYILRFQDENGFIKGITMHDTCSHIYAHKSTYYKMLESLEEKGILHIEWDEKRKYFWSITVLNNSFKNKSDYKDGYINLNTTFLYTDAFLNMTQAEKVICLKILASHRFNRQKISLTFETLMKWTSCTMQSIKKYVQTLKGIFSNIIIGSNMVTIDLTGFDVAFTRYASSEADVYNEHVLGYILALKKVQYDETEKKDTLKLFNIFSEKHGEKTVISAILNCIDTHKKLIPKYINTMIHITSKNKLPLQSI